MGLEEYNAKRDFKTTPEPSKRGSHSEKGHLLFCIQMHDATHLHYDFRLELDGVLKSWAIPKGPSLNPKDKRLAIQVEDHPYDYRTFEGTIPMGNYGAGKVIVWDEGTYSPLGAASRKESEKLMQKMLAKGHVHIVLFGHKIKGDYSLVRLQGATENQWLLIKGKDEFVSQEEILLKNKSVLSSRMINPHLEETDTIKKKSLNNRLD